MRSGSLKPKQTKEEIEMNLILEYSVKTNEEQNEAKPYILSQVNVEIEQNAAAVSNLPDLKIEHQQIEVPQRLADSSGNQTENYLDFQPKAAVEDGERIVDMYAKLLNSIKRRQNEAEHFHRRRIETERRQRQLEMEAEMRQRQLVMEAERRRWQREIDNQLLANVMEGQTTTVQMLLDSGANTNVRDKNRNTPLHHAANKGYLEIVQLLVNRKAIVNAQTLKRNTPLHAATRSGHLDIVKFLIDQGADIYAETVGGNTVMHDAAYRGYLDIIKFLHTQGSFFQIRNSDGKTPLQLAKDKIDLETISLIERLDGGHQAQARSRTIHGNPSRNLAYGQSYHSPDSDFNLRLGAYDGPLPGGAADPIPLRGRIQVSYNRSR